MGIGAIEQGYYSVVRWRPDVTRDEARNIAVVLVDPEGQFSGVRTAPPSALSRDLHLQGFLDGILQGLKAQFQESSGEDLARLRGISEHLSLSLDVSPPKPTAVPDPQKTLDALYKAFVARPTGSGGSLTKGAITDKVVAGFRARGFRVRRGQYVGDFVFDVIVDREEGPLACDVMSFATGAKDFSPAEWEAGHFLFGLRRLELPGVAVIEPPPHQSHHEAQASYDRVEQWCGQEQVPVRRPDQVAQSQLDLKLV